MIRTDSDFMSQGTRCSGWLFLPDNTDNPPVVVMAHGFGAESTFRLLAFAERFVEAGLAVYLFDYRGLGSSEGRPRQWVSPRRHLQDWLAAIDHVKALPTIDSKRMALWGSSFSGGHVLVAAAQTSGLRAVVSQVPAVDGLEIARTYDFKYKVTALFHALWDVTSSLILRKPHYVAIASEPGKFAAMNKADSLSGYLKIVPGGARFDNRCLARVPGYEHVLPAHPLAG